MSSFPAATSGVGKPTAVTLSGSGITKVVTSSGQPGVTNEYQLSLSLSASGGLAATCQLTAQAVDQAGSSQSNTGIVYASYSDPVFTGFNPAVPSATAVYPAPTRSNGVVASVSGSGLITAIGLGKATIEAQVPFGGDTDANVATSYGNVLKQAVIGRVIVTVVA